MAEEKLTEKDVVEGIELAAKLDEFLAKSDCGKKIVLLALSFVISAQFLSEFKAVNRLAGKLFRLIINTVATEAARELIDKNEPTIQ